MSSDSPKIETDPAVLNDRLTRAMRELPPAESAVVAARALLRAQVAMQLPAWLTNENVTGFHKAVEAIGMVVLRQAIGGAVSSETKANFRLFATSNAGPVRLLWSAKLCAGWVVGVVPPPGDWALEAVIAADGAFRDALLLTASATEPITNEWWILWKTAAVCDAEELIEGNATPVAVAERPLWVDSAGPIPSERVFDFLLTKAWRVHMGDLGIDEIPQRFRQLAIGGLTVTLLDAFRDWKDAVPVIKSWRSETKLDLRREAGEDERSLDVDRRAQAIAKLLTHVSEKEQLTFAVLGDWGSGKSFLMRHVEARLPPSHAIVHFNADKYPTTPQLWVHLYETAADTMVGDAWYKTVPQIVRTGLARSGIVPLLVSLITFAVAITPIARKIEFAWTILSGAGVFGALLLAKIYYGVRRTGPQIIKQYFTVPRHAEKLGLQAVIGDDFKALLRGWVPGPAKGSRLILGILLYLCAAAFVARAFLSWPCRPEGVVGFLLWGEWPDVKWIGFIVWCALAVFVLVWVLCGRRDVKRIVLVVDNLDRLDGPQMLTVIESLRLMLDDPDVAARVHVVMLVDERVFRTAVSDKYGPHLRGKGNEPIGQQRLFR
jgi:hypothetical protein